MKRRALISHLGKQDCELSREDRVGELSWGLEVLS